MNIQFGKRFERSECESPGQFTGALHAFYQNRPRGLVLHLELTSGGKVRGVIDKTDSRSVTLESAEDTSSARFTADEIAAFTLPDDAPIDHSDELRGIG